MAVTFGDLRQKAEEYHSWMIGIRRHLHRNPEISYQEHDTTEFIAEKLEELGISVQRPLGTGCIGIIQGKSEHGGPESDQEGGQQEKVQEEGAGTSAERQGESAMPEGRKEEVRDDAGRAETATGERVIALRADIDALAMDEQGHHKKEFMSERPGAAHCCGHDAHTANLLGAARIITGFADQVRGKVVLIFQPGEETLPGGGRLLCESGVLQKLGVGEIYGLHTSPMHAPGTIAVKSGPMMARPDEFEIELTGKGGHAAAPHLAVDPVVMAAEVITGFQTIISRSVDPTEPAVLTIGKVEAGSTYNVIPEKAFLKGTVRTFRQDTAWLIRDRMEQILDGVAKGAGGSFRFQFNEGYPSLINDEHLTRKLQDTAAALSGKEAVLELERPVMAGEDFAFYQQHFPGTFFFLGSGSEEAESGWSWHHPKYNVDERCFLTGAPLMAAVALGL